MEIDKQTIKALSADARVKILKILNVNRRIAAGISKELGLAPSTVNEHLKTMKNAGLVIKNDTGHKWIYYEITEKGKSMITPKMPVNIILTLSLGIGLAMFGGAEFFAENMLYSGSMSVQSVMEKAPGISDMGTNAAAAAPAASWLPLVILGAGLVLVVYGFIKLRRK